MSTMNTMTLLSLTPLNCNYGSMGNFVNNFNIFIN